MVIIAPGLDVADLAQRAPYWILQWSLIMFPSAMLLVATPKSSILRIAWMPCLALLLHNLLRDLLGCSAAFAVRNVVGGMFFMESQHLLSIIIFIWPDAEDFERGKVFNASDSLMVRTFRTIAFFYNLRGLGTSWQIKRINPFSGFLNTSGSGGKPERARFLVRQMAVIAWQWLFLDLIYEGALKEDPEKKFAKMGTDLEFIYDGLNTEQWLHRFVAGFVSWIGPTRVFLDLIFRMTSFVSVALMMSEPESWPPSFGTMGDMYSIRSFWGKAWHQYLRRPLTTISNFTTRRVLRLPTPSLLERYLNITLVFLLSGVAHAGAAWYDPNYQPSAYLPTIAFFLASAIGIMLEDAVQALWRWATGSRLREEDEPVVFWHRLVGFIWLAIWLTLTGPWMVYSPARFDSKYSWFVPVRVVPYLGESAAVIVVAVGAGVLMFGFGARP